MNVRADIAELLRAGLSDRAIAKQLHTDSKGVAVARRTLGIPRVRSGIRPSDSPEELFLSRTRRVKGGHMKWLGGLNGCGLPAFRHGGRLFTAYRVAFRIHNGREPIGRTGPGCGRPLCVAPAHIDDQPARTAAKALYAQIFGGAE
ncbi:hypothetical protein LG634_24850 [Streptomyces bambusae]|uniref:hypothetical protein n=1 Tax=Streptomyces bambusae TaxID=1550616 RepID=UPI001CFCD103|nr:hypothetical protein [Streptomyces bambusae]MCB5168043.1 hypothetical protein [Streptomyces bambusae]